MKSLVWYTLAAALFAASHATADESSTGAPSAELAPIVVGSLERIDVRPARVVLGSPRRAMHLVTSGFYAGDLVQDLTRAAEYLSTDAKVVRVENGVVYPVGDGAAEVLVKVGEHEERVPVEVANFNTTEQVSFQDGTLLALTKQGCNQGACHGSPSGKGGFRLSLRAYDAVLDIYTLARENAGRRTNPLDPEASLILQKPLMEVAHGGGKRLDKSDASYAILRDWIAQGCRLDPPSAATCERIEVFPRQRVLHRPAHTQQLVVLGHFTDGTTRDVTPLVSFSSSDEAVATVDENGFVIGHDRGEAAILVRYLDKMQSAYLMFLKDVENFDWPNPPENNFVDQHVFAKLRQMQIAPSELCTDEEFIRRVHLDVLGILPTVAEVETFLADGDAKKRERLVDQLLDRSEYAEYWALKWADLLRVKSKSLSAAGMHKFYRWLVANVRQNTPYDQFAQELLTASGSTFANPAANYYRASVDFNDCTETTSQLFLGVRIQCAKCHNHPFEKWTQDNYYGIGAFFNRVQTAAGSNADEKIIRVSRTGEVVQPRTGQQMKPWLPLTGDADVPAGDDRRDVFAEWLTSAANPFFAKVEVNRVWGHLFGRGIVEPVDDFRESNPPSNAALLDALAAEFASSGFDRKHILRVILNSRAYQLSSRKNDFNRDDVKYFSHARTRMLSAEQLLDAICQVTAVPEKFEGLPVGVRATALPSPDVNNYFLKVFGQPARETACACERSSDSNLSQALQMINGPLIHAKLRDENNRLRQLAKAGKNDRQIVAELYKAALCRPPSKPELAAATRHIAASDERLRGLEDVCWAILNANEFLFQH